MVAPGLLEAEPFVKTRDGDVTFEKTMQSLWVRRRP